LESQVYSRLNEISQFRSSHYERIDRRGEREGVETEAVSLNTMHVEN
jgi:hypothetical protein